MGYVKKRIRLINEILDDKELPDKWDDFVKESYKSENILLKRKGNKLYCTCCDKEFDIVRKINKLEKCPFCHQKLEVKNWNLKRLCYRKTLILVDVVDNEYIFRIFELRSDYLNDKWDRSVVEYGRYFFNERQEIIKDIVCNNMGGFYISHSETSYNKNKWRTLNSYWKNLITYGEIYPYNLKKLFSNSEYKYSQLWNLVKTKKEVDIYTVLSNASKGEFEILTKMKLYNLALALGGYDLHIKYDGNFQNRFGVPKSFYKLMKKYDINAKELDRLKLLDKPNIKNVRYLLRYSFDYLEDVKEYMSIEKFINYSRKIKNFDLNTYIDYLKFCKVLGYDMKDKKVLFLPNKKEIIKKHDELENQYEINKNKAISKSIKRRYKELKDNIFKDKKFIVTPANTVNSMIDESKQQNNCVRTYTEDYANGTCDIYFMRLISDPNKSLVTIEVRNNKVVQQRIKNNQDTTKQQKKFIDLWEKRILQRSC